MPIPGSQFQSEQFAVSHKARPKRVNVPNVKGAIMAVRPVTSQAKAIGIGRLVEFGLGPRQ
jgi:hypothetical protein